MGFEIKRNTSSLIKGSVNTFSDLSNISNPSVNDYYLVRKSTGIPLINRKTSGLYYWDGENWKDDDKDILNNIIDIQSDITELKDFNRTIFISENYLLPVSADFKGFLNIKNVSSKDLIITTQSGDKIEDYSSIRICPRESFTVQKRAENDYRII